MIDFKNEYSKTEFSGFLKDFLPDFETSEENIEVNKKFKYLKSLNKIGQSKTIDVKVFEINHESENDPRVSLSKESFILMKELSVSKALIVFKNNKSQNYRFSLITFESRWDEGTKIKTEFSNPRRYSFFLGPNAKVKTPNQFLIKNGIVKDIDDLKSRFSIEVVNKQFYKEISQAFTKLVSGLLKLPDTVDKSQANLEFAVRLIGRIIFCWFLKEKKNENNNSLVPKELLSHEAISKNADYYHKILEPIFFEILNKPIKERIDKFRVEPYSTIPYLNGGLFSPDKNSDYYKLGIYQSDFYNNLVVPDEWLKDFFAILETYNFTIDENTSYDEELSIDPEMLGRIFENLLAEINPETGESARKSTGSYYTPRIIVDYMVDESLLLYLKQQTEIKEEKLKAVISYELADDDDNPLTLDEREKIVNALEKVKILDPACGSGAFPIGALQKIVFILQQVDPDGSLWFKKQLAKASPEFRKDIEKKFSNKEFDFLRKLGVIRECIYGVDIQPIATEISRLRCFLTLIVDERIDDNEENRGIKPLPNLDFKFVTANSLIGLPTISKNEPQQPEMFDDRENIDELKNIRDQYFTSSGIEREKLKLEFSEQQKILIKQMYKEHGYAGMAKSELTQKLTDWEPFTHKQADWFDTEWMFGVKDGFDIVIGNPPYVNIKKIETKLRKIYWQSYLEVLVGDMDIYQLFFVFGIRNLKKAGILSFVSSDSFLTNQSFRLFRDYLLNNCKIISIHDFPYRFFPFKSVNTETCFIILSKDKVVDSKQVVGIKICDKKDDDINLQINNHVLLPVFPSNNGFYLGISKTTKTILGRINDRIATFSDYFTLSNPSSLDRKERYPITSSKNYDKCVFTTDEVDKDPELARICEEAITGDKILRYKIHGNKIFTNIKWVNKGVNRVLNNDTYSLMKEIKLVGQRITGQAKWRIVFTLDQNGLISMPSVNIINVKKQFTNAYLYNLLGLLNSRLYNYLYKDIFKENNTNITSDVFKVIPFPKDILISDELGLVVKKMIEDEYDESLDQQIDQTIYKLYGLTQDEIKIIENSIV